MVDKIFSFGLPLLAFVLPISIAATNIVFFPLLAVWLLGARSTFRKWPPTWGPVEIVFLAFLAISLLSAAIGFEPAHSFHIIWMKDFYVLILVFLTATVREEEQAFRLFRIFMIAGVGTALWGLFQCVVGVNQTDNAGGQFIHLPAALASWPRPLLNLLSLVNGRVIGTRSHPIHYAECLLFNWAIAVSFVATCPKRALGKWLFMTGIIGAALLASQSRGPWLAAAAVWLLALVFSTSPRGWFLLVGSVLLLAVLWHIPVLHDRSMTIVDDSYRSNQERVQMWRAGRALWATHPCLGIGPGAVKDVSAALPEASGRPPEGWGHLHNLYVNFAAERGLLGLGAYLLMIVALVWEEWEALRVSTSSPIRQTLLRAALLSVIGFLICGVTETAYNTAVVQMTFYFMAGLALALARHHETSV